MNEDRSRAETSRAGRLRRLRRLRFGVTAVAAGALCTIGLTVVPASVANASTTANLFVDNVHGTKTTGCTSAGTGACKTIQQGINAAETLQNTAVTLYVTGSPSHTYDEIDHINIVAGTNDTLEIFGVGAAAPTLDDGGTGTDLTLDGTNVGAVTIFDMTISGGSSNWSGGINDVGTGALTVIDDTFTNNVAVQGGGAIDAADTCGTAGGHTGKLTVLGSTFIDNGQSSATAGAINTGSCTGTGSFYVANSTFVDNPGYGQVDFWDGGDLFNSTIVWNGSAPGVGGPFVSQTVSTLAGDTISGSVGAAIYTHGGTVNLADSVLDDTGGDCAGPAITDLGYNVVSDSSCALGSNSIAHSTTIGLQPLAGNGAVGPQTEAITSSSSAYHEVPKSACLLTTDERGRLRPGIGTACDAGAFELEPPPGYDLVGSDGGVFVFPKTGGFYGSLPGLGVHVSDVVGIVPTLSYHGYDLVGSDGGVFVFPLHQTGGFYGSLPGLGVKPAAPIVAIVPNLTDTGYYLVGKDGGVFAFHTTFAGSLPGIGDHVDDVVGIAATADDKGYWVVEADGAVHAFGDAVSFGNGAARHSPAVSITIDPNGRGYWIAYADGTVVSKGGVVTYGSTPSPLTAPVVSLVPTTDGLGYWLVGKDGNLYPRGDATNQGSLPALHVSVNNIVGAVPTA
jgi:predicted outer membrane repeat protein